MQRVDLTLFMIDGRLRLSCACGRSVAAERCIREQPTVADEDVAIWIRDLFRDSSKILLVANKCEAMATNSSKSMDGGHSWNIVLDHIIDVEIRDHLMDAYRLGLGSPVAISAETGDGMIDLCEALIPFIPQPDPSIEASTADSSVDQGDNRNEKEEPGTTETTNKPEASDDIIKVAIMGLPNVVCPKPTRFLAVCMLTRDRVNRHS